MVLAIHAIAVKRVLQIKTLSTFGKMIKNKTLKEVHNYFIEILGFDEKSSEIKSNLQKNKEYDELVIGWFSTKNMSGGSALRPRWPPQPNLI